MTRMKKILHIWKPQCVKTDNTLNVRGQFINNLQRLVNILMLDNKNIMMQSVPYLFVSHSVSTAVLLLVAQLSVQVVHGICLRIPSIHAEAIKYVHPAVHLGSKEKLTMIFTEDNEAFNKIKTI